MQDKQELRKALENITMGLSSENTPHSPRDDYKIASGAVLEESERRLLSRYGHWLEALATGTITPSTPEQVQFVRVARGEADAESAFEIAWTKHQSAIDPTQPQVGPMELASRLERLRAAKVAALMIQREYAERKATIMERIKPLLDALEAEFSGRMRATGEEVSRLEAESREAVTIFGASFRHAGVRAVYTRPRVSWDSRGLHQYMETHPEVAEFRRIGKPSVRLQFDGLGETSTDQNVAPSSRVMR